MGRKKRDGGEWDFGDTECQRCGSVFHKTSPRSAYCKSCSKLRTQERERERYTEICGGASALEIQKRMLAAKEAKDRGLDVMLVMDVWDGLKEDEEVSEFLYLISPQFAELVPVIEGPKKVERKLSLKNRKVDEVFEGEILFILYWNDQEREVVRRKGDWIAEHQVDDEDMKAQVVLMFVDEESWLEEPVRL